MKTRHAIMPILTATALMAACSAEENTSLDQMGFARFSVQPASQVGVQPDGPFALELATADGQYSARWANIADYLPVEPLYTGPYRARVVSGSEGSEGYDCPCFIGQADFIIAEGLRADVVIPATLQQALVSVDIDDQSPDYTLQSVTIHTHGHGYNVIDPENRRPLYIQPGSTTAYVSVTSTDGTRATLAPNLVIDTHADTQYSLTVDLTSDGNLMLACGSASATLDIDAAMLDGAEPSITAQGFDPGEPLVLTEGYPAAQPVVMTVNAPTGIARMDLSVQGSLGGTGLSSQYEILDDTDSDLLVSRPTDTQAVIDFTQMLEKLTVDSNTDLTFTLVALDRVGRVSEPCQLHVVIRSVDFSLVSQTAAVLGTNVASVTMQVNADNFQRDDFSVYMADANGQYTQLPIIDAHFDPATRTIILSFNVGEGITDEHVRIDFMGVPKIHTTIERAVPDYAISVDAYANRANIYIDARTLEEQHAITRYARVFIDGTEHTVTYRDIEGGWVSIGGLKASTRYTASTQVIPAAFAPHTTFTTEADSPIPGGDFEDAAPSISYNALPQGGMYSNTPFPVYSQQNHTDVNVWWPKRYWANVNAKTFCRQASNHNTWYMQPSATIDYDVHASGSKSVRLTSVGWSLDGPEIEPYRQTDGQQLPYNANVPAAGHRSAGRLFLGSYAFDPATMTETYTQGVPFASRPTSLNGFYKFQPDAYDSNDRGIVTIELIGRVNGFEVVIASATMQFAPVADMMAFNLPLDYHYYNVKAERLCLMFASSSHIGDIAQEDAAVAVTPDLPSSTFRGNQLWIDNLSLSY